MYMRRKQPYLKLTAHQGGQKHISYCGGGQGGATFNSENGFRKIPKNLINTQKMVEGG